MELVLFRLRIDDVADRDIVVVDQLYDDAVALVLHGELSEVIAELTVDDGLVAEAFDVSHAELDPVAVFADLQMFRTYAEDNRFAAPSSSCS